MRLSDFISPDSMVARSVNIERDMGAQAALSRYHLTGKGIEIISRLVAALNGERISAWSLTGPYGMGKSSFVNYLLALCGPEAEEETRIARRMIQQRDKDLAHKLSSAFRRHSAADTGLFRVAGTSSFESINRTLARSIHRALMDRKISTLLNSGYVDELRSTAENLLNETMPDTGRLVELFRNIRKSTGIPVAIVVDEFGKNLEYMARFPAQGDLFALQALAETEGIFMWVCLHQAFEEYTSRLSARQLQEWGKIQGRFEDISFVESKSEMIRFICKTLLRKDNGSIGEAVKKWAQYYHSKANGLALTELRDFDIDTIERLYPLNPLTAAVLPELCMRFAQNERSLSAFLCSGEPNALPAYLAGEPIDPDSPVIPTFGPERLYDYFLSHSSTALMNRPESHRWIEIHDIIERSRSIDPFELKLLKVIGLLNLISGPSGFRASEKMISFAFLEPDLDGRGADLQKAIKNNIDRGVLIYREYADEFRLWEGTDFDIPAAVRERKAILAGQALDTVLKDTLPLPPLTAARHSYVTGTLRHFERRWCSLDDLKNESTLLCAKEMDGLILYCYGRESDIASPPRATLDGKPIIVCYTAGEDQIVDLVLEAAATKAVLNESPELAHDGVARKEARFRARAAEERLRSFLAVLFGPENKEASWFVMGEPQKLESFRDLSRVLSAACDRTYFKCPVIRNELINRTGLSTAAARARRELMEAMVLNESEEKLGLHGTGPEVAIYRSMLLAEGLHRKTEGEAWRFVSPEPGSNYFSVWETLDEATQSAGDSMLPLTEIIQMLRRAPFGLKDGPIPIILCLYLIVNSDELALYQEGSFIPWLGPEEMELMSKRPEYFAVRRFQQAKLRGGVFQLYLSLLKAKPSPEGRKLRNETLISVVGPLMQFIKTLKPYALHTKALSRHAHNVRHVLQHARDPFDLLYVQLPRAVGLDPFEEPEKLSDQDLALFRDRFTKAVLELRNAYPKLMESIKHVILDAFGASGEIGPFRTRVKQRASNLLGRSSDPHLKPFLATLVNFDGSDEEWLVSVATIVSQRPVDSWRDQDRESFAINMRDFVGRFCALETLVAKTEYILPAKHDGREPRMLSVVGPDGKTTSTILWKNNTFAARASDVVEKLIEEYGSDRSALETILVLMSERLLADKLQPSEEV